MTNSKCSGKKSAFYHCVYDYESESKQTLMEVH